MVSFQGSAELFSRVGPAVSLGRRWVALAALLFASACSQPTGPAPGTSSTGEWRTFEGTWTAAGTRHALALGTDHRASIFDLTGSLLLIGSGRLGVGFRAQAIGFSDSLTGMQGRCVWTDERGDKIYSQLQGEFVATGNHIVGTFLGGTGRYAGVTGEYSFQWEYVVESDEGSVSGRAINLKGRALLGSAAAAPGGEHSQ
jgi:hypothetical protein